MSEAKTDEVRAWLNKSQCMHFEQEFATLRQAAITLTPYAVASRYPGDLPELSEEEAREAVALARQVWDFVLSRFPTSLDLP